MFDKKNISITQFTVQHCCIQCGKYITQRLSIKQVVHASVMISTFDVVAVMPAMERAFISKPEEKAIFPIQVLVFCVLLYGHIM